MIKNIKAGADIHAGDGGYSEGNLEDYEAFVAIRNKSLAGGWVCNKCGTDRTKAGCPLGHMAALEGKCPMTAEAQ